MTTSSLHHRTQRRKSEWDGTLQLYKTKKAGHSDDMRYFVILHAAGK